MYASNQLKRAYMYTIQVKKNTEGQNCRPMQAVSRRCADHEMFDSVEYLGGFEALAPAPLSTDHNFSRWYFFAVLLSFFLQKHQNLGIH